MRFGFVGSYGSAAQVVQMAQEAEAHGWDGFFTWDGISVGEMDTWDPWSLLGALAVSTERIRLGAMVFALARRRPWKVARESITVDHLSGGRLIMPVALGAVDDGGFSRVSGEARTARERADRLDDALGFLSRAWSGESFSYTGTHVHTDDLVFRPTPVQKPRIPVWVVGSWPSERSMGRAARWDGILPQRRGDPLTPLTPAEIREVVAWVHERRAADGATWTDDAALAYDVVVEGVLPDDPAEAAERARAFADAGATWWIESRWDVERDTPAVLLDRIRQGPPQL